jgi:hypothetical protein
LQTLNRKDDWFVCHKATLAGQQVMCKGDYEQRPTCRPARLARALGIEPHFVTETQLKEG